jgi:CubicO group peptidase (beta-lactamase class C family)
MLKKSNRVGTTRFKYLRKPAMNSVLTCLVFTVSLATVSVAQESREVRRGESIPGTLTADGEHRFRIELNANTLVYGEVNQVTVDVVVRVLDPAGDVLRSFNSPARGPEKFTFDTEEPGSYIIEVSSVEEDAGDYVLRIMRAERVATDAPRRVDQILMPFDDPETPGAVIGVVQDGKLVFTRAYGMANLPHQIAFDTGTISNIGSVSKQFTAMGLLVLEARGKLSLEDDITEYIPELPNFGTTITLRNLLNHTGGYREVYNLLPMTGYQGEDALSRDRVIQIVQRQPELQARPNTEFNYNNTGYVLLATAIERITDTTFAEYMRTTVFEPLGMMHTRVKTHQGEVIPGSADGYVPSRGGGYRSARDLAASYGAGGIYTTVEDLAKWMLNYRDHTIGGQEAIRKMTTNAILENGDSTGYGLGLGVGTFRGRRIWQHTGGDTAHRTYFGYYPDLESGVIVMSNNGSFSLGVASQIALAFFEDEFDPEETEAEVAAEHGMSEERLHAIAGEWRIETPTATLNIIYTVEDGELFAQATGQPQIKLTPTTDSTVTFVGVEASVTFHFEDDGTVRRATHHQGPSMPMTRIEKVELTTEDLEEFVGTYYSEEVETLFEIKLVEDTLKAYNIRMDPLALTHTDGDEFSAPVFFFASIEFQRSANDRITGFMASNGRTKNVWFRRQ